MRTIVFSLCLLLLLLFPIKSKPSVKKEQQKNLTQIKVAAYNVEYSQNASAEEIGKALKLFDFDVVCFSETPEGDWTKEVGSVLGLNYVVVGKYPTAGHDNKYKTIISRTPLYDSEEVLMADTLHTVTKAKTKINNIEIVIYSVHFPFGWRDQAHIDETTGKITSFANYLKVRQNEDMAVVMGDFNFIPSNSENKSPYYEMFVGIGLDVTWKELRIDCTKYNSWDAFKTEDKGNGEVIDHIMYNPKKMKAMEGHIIEMEKPLSDHKPVWATFQIK